MGARPGKTIRPGKTKTREDLMPGKTKTREDQTQGRPKPGKTKTSGDQRRHHGQRSPTKKGRPRKTNWATDPTENMPFLKNKTATPSASDAM